MRRERPVPGILIGFRMSRTDKDRPYWVMQNDPENLTKTDHDHTRLGEVYYKTVPVLDKHGKRIYDSTEWSLPAEVIVQKQKWLQELEGTFAVIRKYSYEERATHGEIPGKARLKAFELMAAGRYWEHVPCGTYDKLRTREVVHFTVADHCTAGEPIDPKQHRWSQPCTPEWPFAGRAYHAMGMANKKGIYSREYYGGQRGLSNATLKRVANEWNNGYDVENWDEDTDLTAQHRHSMAWNLW